MTGDPFLRRDEHIEIGGHPGRWYKAYREFAVAEYARPGFVLRIGHWRVEWTDGLYARPLSQF